MQTFTHGATGEGAGWRNRHRVHDDCRLENASARPARRGVLGLSSGLRHCLWAALVFSTCMWPWCVGAGPGRRANTHTHKEKRCCCKGCGGTCASLGGASRQFPAGPRHVCCSVQRVPPRGTACVQPRDPWGTPRTAWSGPRALRQNARLSSPSDVRQQPRPS